MAEFFGFTIATVTHGQPGLPTGAKLYQDAGAAFRDRDGQPAEPGVQRVVCALIPVEDADA